MIQIGISMYSVVSNHFASYFRRRQKLSTIRGILHRVFTLQQKLLRLQDKTGLLEGPTKIVVY